METQTPDYCSCCNNSQGDNLRTQISSMAIINQQQWAKIDLLQIDKMSLTESNASLQTKMLKSDAEKGSLLAEIVALEMEIAKFKAEIEDMRMVNKELIDQVIKMNEDKGSSAKWNTWKENEGNF